MPAAGCSSGDVVRGGMRLTGSTAEPASRVPAGHGSTRMEVMDVGPGEGAETTAGCGLELQRVRVVVSKH